MKKGTKMFILISFIILIVLLSLATIFVIYDLYLLTGILKFYRIIGSVIIALISFILGQTLLFAKKDGKKVKYIIFFIMTFIYIVALSVGGYYAYRIINNLDSFSKESTTYSTSLITFTEKYKELNDLDGKTIGIVSDKTDITNYALPMQIIKEEKLESLNEIKEYESTLELLTALYNEEVDAIFINSDYESLYGKLEEYSDISKKAILIKKVTKDLKDINTDIEEVVDSSDKTLTEPFTILLLGVDSESDGLNPNSAFNGDTMMMITFNPNTLQATMFSLPRDTYIPISCSGNRINKANTSAYGGASCVVKTLQNLTGINIDYYAMINFKGVVSLVDALGGITVNVPMEFCEQDSNRLFGAHEICLKPGEQVLNGESALALSRHRKTLLLGDFQRGQNQQLVVEGMLQQLKSIKNVNQALSILDIVNKNLYTNITKEQILSLYEVGKKMIISDNTNLFNIQKTFLTGYDLNVFEPASMGVRYAFFHYKQSLESITTAMKENLGLIEITPIKTFSFSINEIYEKEIIGKKYYSESRYQVLPNFSGYTIQGVINYGNANGLPVSVVDNNGKTITSGYENYRILYQKEEAQTLLVRLNSITLIVANKFDETNEGENNEDDKISSSSTSSKVSTSEPPEESEESEEPEEKTSTIE